MKKEDIKELTTEELSKKVDEQRLVFKKTKFNHKVSQIDDPMKLKIVKKDIARLLTELRYRELHEKKAEDGPGSVKMKVDVKSKSDEKEIAKKNESKKDIKNKEKKIIKEKDNG